MEVSDNKRIAKNTVMLYIRMLLSIVVSLYTSRVVLQTLGVEDYGIYSVVGGVVAMFGFLNASMSGATSRFLTFEMGRGDFEKLRDTFSSALIIHIGIALIVFVVAETLGLWFLSNKLVIPEERMFAAHVVYQLSIISMMVGVTQVPYNASIIAHEKMDVYAYVELLNVFLKLGIVYLLLIGNFDKLILYAVLMLFVSVIVAMTYRIYSLRNFNECHFRRIWRKDILKPMLSFSGWDLFGNMSVTVRQQGVNFLINIFFGVAYNAASGVASTVQSVILGLSNNLLMAFRPQIIKNYSIGYIHESVSLMLDAMKLSCLLFMIIALPVILEMDYIMNLWLKEPPLYATEFCRLMLISGCLNTMGSSLNIGIHATGKIKKMSVFTGWCYLLVIPLLWFCYKLGAPVAMAYILIIFQNIACLIIRIFILEKYIDSFNKVQVIKNVLLPVLGIVALTFLLTFPIVIYIGDGFWRCLIVFSESTAIFCMLGYKFTLSIEKRKILKQKFFHIKGAVSQ